MDCIPNGSHGLGKAVGYEGDNGFIPEEASCRAGWMTVQRSVERMALAAHSAMLGFRFLSLEISPEVQNSPEILR